MILTEGRGESATPTSATPVARRSRRRGRGIRDPQGGSLVPAQTGGPTTTGPDATLRAWTIDRQGQRHRFGYLEAGPGGPLALCLHGFPDTAHTWRHFLPRLAEAGFHAVARSCGGTPRPTVPEDGRYDTGTLALDACALHAVLGGRDDAVIIGHDWGAFAAYGAAAFDRSGGGGWWWPHWLPRRPWPMDSSPTSSSAAAGTSSSSSPPGRVRRDPRRLRFHRPPLGGLVSGIRRNQGRGPGGGVLGRTRRSSVALGYYRATFAGPPDDPDAAAAQSL